MQLVQRPAEILKEGNSISLPVNQGRLNMFFSSSLCIKEQTALLILSALPNTHIGKGLRVSMCFQSSAMLTL